MTKCTHCDATVLSATPAVGGERETLANIFEYAAECIVFHRTKVAPDEIKEIEHYIMPKQRELIASLLRAQPASPLRGRAEVVEECAKIAAPWQGAWLDHNSTEADREVVKVRQAIADNIRLLAGRSPEQPASPLRGRELHPDTQDLVEKLSWALEDKLLRAQRKYGYTNGWLVDDWKGECQLQLIEHLEKGDPLDVVAYAAFMWARGWPTSASPPEQPAGDPVTGGPRSHHNQGSSSRD